MKQPCLGLMFDLRLFSALVSQNVTWNIVHRHAVALTSNVAKLKYQYLHTIFYILTHLFICCNLFLKYILSEVLYKFVFDLSLILWFQMVLFLFVCGVNLH